MKKVFVDTNIWLRFFLKDEESQFRSVYEFVSALEKGTFRAYTSSIVFLEISYVLKTVYKFSNAEILKVMEAIMGVRNITVLNITNSVKAVEYFKNYNIKFSDCLIASSVSPKMIIVTYDEEFNKIKEFVCKRPEDL